MSAIYILNKGDYHRNRNILVTTDVKQVARKYVNIIKNNGFGDPFDSPYIEVWMDGDESDYPTENFHENNINEKQIIKYLSKSGQLIGK